MGFLEKTVILSFILYIHHIHANSFENVQPNNEHFQEKTGEDDEIARIIGGQDAEDGQFPYAGALLRNRGFICTSSLIAKDAVLTAAHCVRSNGITTPARSLTGIFGAVDRTSSSATNIQFTEVVVHPLYHGFGNSVQNDIAILRMNPINFTDTIRPVCLARKDTGLNEYKDAMVMGWGTTKRIARFISPNELQYVESKVLHHLRCMASYPGTVTHRMICSEGNGRGVCSGDSGGPMVHLSGKKEVQIGVASFVRAAPGCASPEILFSPAVMTRVAAYHDWIKSVIGESNMCTQ